MVKHRITIIWHRISGTMLRWISFVDCLLQTNQQIFPKQRKIQAHTHSKTVDLSEINQFIDKRTCNVQNLIKDKKKNKR